jgi:hypothetical protein
MAAQVGHEIVKLVASLSFTRGSRHKNDSTVLVKQNDGRSVLRSAKQPSTRFGCVLVLPTLVCDLGAAGASTSRMFRGSPGKPR